MAEVEQLFDKIEKESGTLDILVNNAYQAVQAISNNVSKRFYECDPEIWDEVNNVGLRNHYFCSVFAARIMVKNFSGLIVNISSAGGLTYFLNVPYGVGKCAVDRMAQDMAHELKGKGVTVVSLWPSLVKTELMDKLFKDEDKLRDLQNASGAISKISPETMKQNFNDNESTEFPGKAIVALASDSAVIRKTGRVLLTADLGDEYGFLDVDGGKPASIRSVSALLKLAGCSFLYPYLPRWIKVPGWVMTAFTSKL
ncbi:hypothetical protein L596_007369 [Steinernema carpocapsae]|uniref:Dehydrogenase/reductase SDR family member 1 n=1 Tax=Steinernema carpocapsae TaxID=34508 RepID=A0A4U5P9H7_STECR|nr:hypothetical protein L596_007369 [Steinernema carpocapsae]